MTQDMLETRKNHLSFYLSQLLQIDLVVASHPFAMFIMCPFPDFLQLLKQFTEKCERLNNAIVTSETVRIKIVNQVRRIASRVRCWLV